MRTVLLPALLVACSATTTSAGQQADPSLDRIRAALSTATNPSMKIVAEPPLKTWHGVRLVQPDISRRQFIKVSVPVGEYAMKATRAVGKARQSRAQRKAREEVELALKEFLSQQK